MYGCRLAPEPIPRAEIDSPVCPPLCPLRITAKLGHPPVEPGSRACRTAIMRTIEIQSVLFVEDDADTQAAVRFALQDLHQIQLRVCSSAREGLHAAANFGADLLLLDVMMPEIDGPTALAGLRQSSLHRHTPAIFLTSLVQPDDLRYYRSLGVAGVIPKPFDPLKLAGQIAALLAGLADAPPAVPDMPAELSALHRAFGRELPARLERIRCALAECRADPNARHDWTRLWELIEDLYNAASAHGNHQIAAAARRAEQRAACLVLAPNRSVRDLIEIEMELMGWSH